MAGIMRLHRLLLVPLVSAALALAAAACSKSDVTPSSSTSSCSVTLGSVTTNVGAAASTGSIPVTAASSCSWTAASSASFLTVTSGSSGTGNGTVNYSIAANTGAARSASITVNGTSVNFTQAAATAVAPTGCTVKLSTTNVQGNSGGGTSNVDVTADSNCSWTAASNASFLTISAGASGTGNGTVTITSAANPANSSRTGTVTIGGQTVTVTQDAGVFAQFDLFDPSQTSSATNVCQFRGPAGSTTTCQLRSTSYTQSTASIVSSSWTVTYTYGTVKTLTQSGTSSTMTFSDSCGVANGGATDDGALQPLSVTLTVVDSRGNTSTATSGSGNQQNLFVQLFNCGK